MLTVNVERDGLVATAIWDDGILAGDEPILSVVEGAVENGSTVLLTPTGPTVAVTYEDVHSILRLLEEFGLVTIAGDLPEPQGMVEEDVDY